MKQLVAVLALLAFLPLLGWAQVSASGIIVNVNFSFYAGAKLQPAGSYELRPMSGNIDNALQIVNLKTRESTVVPIITSISKKQPSRRGGGLRSGRRQLLSFRGVYPENGWDPVAGRSRQTHSRYYQSAEVTGRSRLSARKGPPEEWAFESPGAELIAREHPAAM